VVSTPFPTAATASQSATAAGASVIWYLNQYVKYVFSFERTGFVNQGTASRRPEHALVIRLQFNLQPRL
jgi:hypothetical protein